MKNLLIGLTLLSSVTTFASTYQDHVTCSLSAKVGSETSRMQELPRVITISMDVVSQFGSVDVFGLEKNIIKKEWNGYSYSNRSEPVSADVDDLLKIKSINKYVTNDVYVNRGGIHNNRVKEFSVKLKRIKKNQVSRLLTEMGYSKDIQSSSNKNLRLKNDTEFNHKSFKTTLRFSEEKLSTIFTFSCKNSIQIHGQQF